jgi:hypothetical protein
LGGRAAHQLPQSVLLSLHVPAEARPRLKARTRERKSIVSGCAASLVRGTPWLRWLRSPLARLLAVKRAVGSEPRETE